MSRDRDEALCSNWGVLIAEACSDALLDLKDEDAEYAALLKFQEDVVEYLREMGQHFADPALRAEYEKQLDALLDEMGTRELRACYLAGAGDGLQLAFNIGLIKKSSANMKIL